MTQDIKRAARRFYQAVNEGNLALLDEIIAPDVVDHNRDPGQGAGREGIKQAFAEFRRAFPDLHMTVEDMIAERRQGGDSLRQSHDPPR